MSSEPSILLDTEHIEMSPKVYLSRVLAKERVDCPGCGANIRVSTLAYDHRCIGSRPSGKVHQKAGNGSEKLRTPLKAYGGECCSHNRHESSAVALISAESKRVVGCYDYLRLFYSRVQTV